MRRECFLVITLPAVENKRSGAAEVPGISSTRLANTPNQGKEFTAPLCILFFRGAWHAHFGSPHVTEMVVGRHCISWLVPLEISSAEIVDRDIKIWKTRTVPFPKDKNLLDEWRRGAVHLFPWLGVLARFVLAIPATSAAPENLFATAGNVMTKKRHVSRVTTWMS